MIGEPHLHHDDDPGRGVFEGDQVFNADFFMVDEGADKLINVGIVSGASACKFDLSTNSVGSTSPWVVGDNYAGRDPITGTGYTQQSKTRDTPSSRSCTFGSAVQWSTGANADWTDPRSIALSDGTTLYCAWNLQSGGAAREMTQANTTESCTVTFGAITNPA